MRPDIALPLLCCSVPHKPFPVECMGVSSCARAQPLYLLDGSPVMIHLSQRTVLPLGFGKVKGRGHPWLIWPPSEALWLLAKYFESYSMAARLELSSRLLVPLQREGSLLLRRLCSGPRASCSFQQRRYHTRNEKLWSYPLHGFYS